MHKLSDDAMIEYLKVSAADQAATVARERLNFFFTTISIIIAIMGIVAAGFVAYLFQRVETIADFKSEAMVESAMAEERRGIATQFVAIRSDLEELLRDEVAVVTLLPLLTAEVNALADRGGFSLEDRNRIIDVLSSLAPEIRDLDLAARELAFRRIEDILDRFNGAGDYHGIDRVYDIFQEDLLAYPGIHITIATAYVSRILYDESFPASRQESLDRFASHSYDAAIIPLRRTMALFFLTREMVESELEDFSLAAKCEMLEKDHDGDFMANHDQLFSALATEFAPGGTNASAFGLANLEKLDLAC